MCGDGAERGLPQNLPTVSWKVGMVLHSVVVVNIVAEVVEY